MQIKAQLDVTAVHLWRGEQHLLRNVSVQLESGELLQVVGPNGVGKSSLLRVIAGLLPPESGALRWCGADVLQQPAILHAAMAYLGHMNALKNDLTSLENLFFALNLRQVVTHTTCLQMLERLGVGVCAALPVRVLSAGQRRRVALARVVLSQAALWILDEPVTHLDAAGTTVVEQCMQQHLEQGGMIIAAAHQPLLVGYPQNRTLTLN